MWTQNLLEADLPRRWFLDAPEANVMTAARERELLLELGDCRARLARALRNAGLWEAPSPVPTAEFHRLVRELARGVRLAGPDGAALGPVARRYEEIRDTLALANSRLVAHIAKRYFHRGVAASDLVQEGFCGLLAAIDRFDTANNTRLGTYAGWWIRQALQRAIANGAHPVRLNPKQLQKLSKAREGSHDRPDAVAAPSSAVLSRVDRYAVAGRDLSPVLRAQVSLNAPCRIDDSTPLADLLAAASGPTAEEHDLADSLNALLQNLNSREQMVLRLRFGLDGEARHSLNQLGKLLRVSKERVRQIEVSALDKLRGAARPEDLLDGAAGALAAPAGKHSTH